MKRSLTLCFLLLAAAALADEVPPPSSPPPAPAPTAALTGRTLRAGDRVPLPGVAVILDGGAAETLSDRDGRFAFPDLPAGPHTLDFRAPTVAPGRADETLAPGQRLDVRYYLFARERYRSTVRARRVARETVEQSLTHDEISRIPGTQGDVLKAVQNLAGVARAPLGAGQLIVWGSGPLDTRVYVDGVYIPTLYHFGGLRSTVNGEMVAGLTFLPGGFGAEFGRGIGGVVEVDTRAPREGGIHGYAQLDLVDGSLMLEGALTKNLTFAVAARRSVLDLYLPAVTPNAFQLTPVYWDYQARLHFRATPRDDVDLLLLGSDDEVSLVARSGDPGLAAQAASHTLFHRALLRFTHRLDAPGGRGEVSAVASVGYDVPVEFKLRLGSETLSADAEDLGYSLRAVARLPLTPFLTVDAGLDFEGNRWLTHASTPDPGLREGDAATATGAGAFHRETATILFDDLAPFLTATFRLLDGRLVVQPGLRVEIYSTAIDSSIGGAHTSLFVRPEPRLAARLRVADWLVVKGSVGRHTQQTDPAAFSASFGNPNLQPELATEYVAGVELAPASVLTVDVDGFYKDLQNLIVRGEQPGGPLLENAGTGRTYGVQATVRLQPFHHLFGWIAYTLSRSERQEHPDAPWRVFQYDQTHILTLVASYELPRGFQVGLRFRYVTGNPTTPVDGAYADLNGRGYVPIYGQTYSARLPDFHQLDLRVDKTFTFSLWRLSIYLDVENVYNQPNPESLAWSFDYKRSAPVAGLPFLPVLGVRGDF